MQQTLVGIGYPRGSFYDPMCALYLPLWRLDGASFMSRDHYGHLCTNYQALWTPQGRDFDGTDDYIELNDGVATSPLNFTSGNFSFVARIYIDDLTTQRQIFCRGLLQVDGYYSHVTTSGRLAFITNQGVAYQNSYTSADDIVTLTWYTVGVSRNGASAQWYRNGVALTQTSAPHINPVTCARTTKIGIYNDLASYPLDGRIGFFAIWNRALSATEHSNAHIILKRIGG